MSRISTSFELVHRLEDLGWRVTQLDEAELEMAVRHPGDFVVVVVGGDGTVGSVAKRLAGTGVPIAVIPTGTANNIARALGIGVEPDRAIESLSRTVVRDIDMGVVISEVQGDERFIEGFGVGVLAYVMAERARRKHKMLRRSFDLLATELESYAPRRAHVEVDGLDRSGDFLMVSVLNLRTLGPALPLAPDARFDDGELDVVFVRPEHKASVVAQLRRASADGDLALPGLELHRARHVRIRDYGKWSHVDDGTRVLGATVVVEVEPRATRFLVLQPEDVRASGTLV